MDIGDNPFAPSSLIDGALLEDDIGRVDKFTKKIEALQERYEKLGKSLTADEAGSDSLADSLMKGFDEPLNFLNEELKKSEELTKKIKDELTSADFITTGGAAFSPTIAAFSGEESLISTDQLDKAKELANKYKLLDDPIEEVQKDILIMGDLLDQVAKGEVPSLEAALKNARDQLSKLKKDGEINWDEFWEFQAVNASQIIAESLADGDFSGFGDALGSAAASAIGSAVTAGLAVH